MRRELWWGLALTLAAVNAASGWWVTCPAQGGYRPGVGWDFGEWAPAQGVAAVVS